MNVVGRNRINIDRSIFGWKEFQITVGLLGPSVFRKRGEKLGYRIIYSASWIYNLYSCVTSIYYIVDSDSTDKMDSSLF